MVGVLWKSGRSRAALRVEEFGNALLASARFKIYCAYPIDIFGQEFDAASLNALLCAHTRLEPAGKNGDLEFAVNRAIAEVLGSDLDGIVRAHNATLPAAWGRLPKAEAAILAIRNRVPEQAQAVASRARVHYEDEKRFRALVENSSDAITLLDRHGSIRYASASSLRILGYPAIELTGRSTFEFIHPEDISGARRTLRQAVARPRLPIQVHLRVRTKDGEWRWIEATVSNLLEDPDVGAIVANYRDISDRKAAETRIRQDAEQLARYNAELEALAYAATHDLKEPLRTISAFTELLVKDGELDQRRREQYAGYIVEGARRMAALLDDLLAFTQVNAGDPPDRVELAHVVERALENLAASIDESGATITVAALPAVRGNEMHLGQVFQNLISNAIKYRSEAPLEIRITGEQDGQECIIQIADNGIGIDPAYHDHIFGLFKRLHDRRIPGTGIGLATCKKIIEGMGGRIWVESEPGNGSAFFFTLAADVADSAPECWSAPARSRDFTGACDSC
jgi:PAS domain S-box-containing protein